jgi:hypothetical protein
MITVTLIRYSLWGIIDGNDCEANAICYHIGNYCEVKFTV